MLFEAVSWEMSGILHRQILLFSPVTSDLKHMLLEKSTLHDQVHTYTPENDD